MEKLVPHGMRWHGVHDLKLLQNRSPGPCIQLTKPHTQFLPAGRRDFPKNPLGHYHGFSLHFPGLKINCSLGAPNLASKIVRHAQQERSVSGPGQPVSLSLPGKNNANRAIGKTAREERFNSHIPGRKVGAEHREQWTLPVFPVEQPQLAAPGHRCQPGFCPVLKRDRISPFCQIDEQSRQRQQQKNKPK